MSTPQLNRTLGLRLVVVVVIGNIIGSGVYKKVAPMAHDLQSSGWVLICWLLGGIISLFGALSNAEVAGLLADTGGEFSYYKKIYNRFFAFMLGWSLFIVIQTASISSLAYVFAQSLNSIAPLPQVLPSLATFSIGGVFYPFADLNIKLTAIILIVALTFVNTRGIKTGANLGSIILYLVFGGIFVIVAGAISSGHVSFANSFTMATANGKPVTFSAVFTAMLAAFWGYQGWAAIGYVGGEIKDAKRNIPRGIAIGVFVVMGLYMIVNATYLALLSVPALDEVVRAGNKIAAVEAVRIFWGQGGAIFISILILITTLGCAHATILASSRPYYAMAREGLFFKGAGSLNKASAPGKSLKYQCIWACVLVLSGTFDQLTDMIIFAVFFFYGATTVGLFILRKKMPDAPRPYKVWGYPVVPAIVIAFCATLIVNTIFTREREAAIGFILVITGVPMYYLFRRVNKDETPEIGG